MRKYKANFYIQTKERLKPFIRDPKQILMNKTPRMCPSCGYEGNFISMRKYARELRCPNCTSHPRDRLFFHYLNQEGININNPELKILHFSAEPCIFRQLKNSPNYISGDIKKNKYAPHIVNVTDIPYPDNHFDLIICHHVMEHVQNHEQGSSECYRVLKHGGTAIFTVPYDSTLEKAWYPLKDMPIEEVDNICGWDHKRMYGEDFPEIVAKAGFETRSFILNGQQEDLHRGGMDPLCIAKK